MMQTKTKKSIKDKFIDTNVLKELSDNPNEVELIHCEAAKWRTIVF
jgi:hypothetical protein